MDTIGNIKRIMAENKTKYCEFIMCLNNHGNSGIICDINQKNEFCYVRDFESLGFSDLFISYCTQEYLYQMLNEKVRKNTNIVSILPANEPCANELLNSENFKSYCNQNGFNIKVRYQFYKSDAEDTDCCIVKLDHAHKPLVEKSESDRVKQYYQFSMQYFGDCYGIIENNALVSCLSVSKSSNAEFPLAEINWIYTEPPFRNQEFATRLLQSVCPILIKEGYTVTYHCDSNNIASKKTALKAKLQPDQEEIVLERK